MWNSLKWFKRVRELFCCCYNILRLDALREILHFVSFWPHKKRSVQSNRVLGGWKNPDKLNLIDGFVMKIERFLKRDFD
jgi:hypothetical protein